MRRIKEAIPNLFTSANLVFGCLAIIEIFEGRLENVIYYTLLSGIVDFFDGFLARLLNAASPIGKDLDSLADMVSFGVVPGFTMYAMMQPTGQSPYMPVLGLLIVVISALRLARFNNDERQSDVFFGVPTPAIALFVCALPLYIQQGWLLDFLTNYYALGICTLLVSILMIIDVPLLAFKFKHFNWRGNELKFSFMVLALGIVGYFQLLGLPMVILIYVMLSLGAHYLSSNKK